MEKEKIEIYEKVFVWSQGLQEKIEDALLQLPDELKEDEFLIVVSAIGSHLYDASHYDNYWFRYSLPYKELVDSFCKELTEYTNALSK